VPVDALLLLVGSVLSWLRPVFGLDLCPGQWAWTTTAFGALVGLLPTAGAVSVARLRRRHGASYPRSGVTVPLVGLVSCGLLPWLAFSATGWVFRAARSGRVGFTPADLASLAQPSCLGMSQRTYLGSVPVADALGGGPLRAALFSVPLVGVPLAVAFVVWLQARAALRRGPRWPCRFHWLPVLVIALLTGPMPAGATAQLWLGMLVGTTVGLFVVLLVPAPARSPAGVAGWPARPLRPTSAPAARPEAAPPPRSSAPRPASDQWRPAASDPAGRRVPRQHGTAQPAAPPLEAAWAWAEQALARAKPAVQTAVARAGQVARNWSADDWRALLFGGPGGDKPPVPTGVGSTPPAPLATHPGPLPDAVAHPRPGASVVPPAGIPRPRPPATLVDSTNIPGRRFELIRQLGAGGFGGVWLAMDRRLGRRVAIKAALAPDQETELRIRREARALGAVAHPHCVRILDLVDSRSDPGLARLRGLVIVMEYVEGQSLGELVISRGPVDDVTAARIWVRTAGALAAAHQRGVLHRDVKPGNVLLDPRGEPHLIDFGIARAPGDVTLTLHGMVIGTPEFLAPETARGERATPASDAWQLAATICFALTGLPPRGDHLDAASALRAAAAGTPPRHLPRGGAHRQLLAACLASDPRARPGLVEVRRVLERWLAERGHTAGATGHPMVAPASNRTR
jgi:eukaryotic-like serine/threonine-protein kinase